MYLMSVFFFISAAIIITLVVSALGYKTYFAFSATVFILGAATYICAFLKYRKLSFIRDTASSKIGSLQMGFVEIYGRAKKAFNYSLIYRSFVIKETGAGSSSATEREKININRDEFVLNPFFIEDETGVAYINPDKAEIIADNKKWSDRDYYYEESEIKEGDYVYCLGTASSGKDADLQKEIYKAVIAAKKDEHFYDKYDANGDGKISEDEWSSAKKRITQSVIARHEIPENGYVEISKGTENGVFIISNKSEKQLTQKLFIQTAAMLICGILLTVFAVFDALVRLEVFPNAFSAQYLGLFKKINLAATMIL
ncbi:MAG: hypothetical protein LBO62_04500 [Endomicrobium sp.]|jgi:hypothetical protein|nr:hypothetical protein [Endomicrobium sp.]